MSPVPSEPRLRGGRRVRLGVRRAALHLVLSLISLTLPASAQALPRGFFGVAPQTPLTVRDTARMRAGGLETIRAPLFWGGVQPTRKGGFDWSYFDATVETAAEGGWKRCRSSARRRTGPAPAIRACRSTAPASGRAGNNSPAPRSNATGRAGPSGKSTLPAPRIRCRGCRFTPGRSGTRRTSSISPAPPPRPVTRSCCESPTGRSTGSTRGRR
jgi:hypothetical protein